MKDIGRAWRSERGIKKRLIKGQSFWHRESPVAVSIGKGRQLTLPLGGSDSRMAGISSFLYFQTS